MDGRTPADSCGYGLIFFEGGCARTNPPRSWNPGFATRAAFPPNDGFLSTMKSTLIIIGLISILSQVVILRELTVAFYGVELIYILAIGIWLFWTAIGALIGRRKYSASTTVIRFLFILFAFLLPADIILVRGIRLLFGGIPGAYLPFGHQMIAVVLVLLPLGILPGLIFQWAAKLFIEEEKTLAVAYALESAGGLIGGLAATLLLKYGMQNFSIALICSLLSVAIWLLPQKNKKVQVPYIGILSLVCLSFIFLISPDLDNRMTRWNHPDLIETRDSAYSRVTIAGRDGQLVVFENDALGFETEGVTAEELVHLCALHHGNPKQVLIAGGGIEGVIEEILKHSPRQVDCVELNPVLFDLARKHLPETFQESLTSEAVHLYHDDPRRFLKNAGSYDLILVGMPDPTSGQSNRFYTREFFEQCAERLQPGGVLAFRLQASENIWTKFLSCRNAGIYQALKTAFQHILVLPGVKNTVIASNSFLSRGPSRLTERYSVKKIHTRFVSSAYINYVFTNDRFFETATRLAAAHVAPNTDIHPICYRFSSMIWLSKFIPEMINWDVACFGYTDSIRILSCVYLILIFCLFFLIIRYSRRLRRVLLVAVAGFIGIVLETMMILYYQAKNGVLFQNIGVLLMAFMSGLAAGSIIIKKAALYQIKKYGTVRPKLGLGLLTGFGILNLLFWFLLKESAASGIFTIAFLLFCAGFLVSGVFAYTSLAGIEDQKIVVSPLYAADLFGGCVGSLLGSLILIPLFGMGPSAIMMAVLASVALLLV
jgi:spermidine synthase